MNWDYLLYLAAITCIHGMAHNWRKGTESGKSFEKWAQNWNVPFWKGMLISIAVALGAPVVILIIGLSLRGCGL